MVDTNEAGLSVIIDVYRNYEGKITDDLLLPRDINQMKTLLDSKFVFHLDQDSIFDYEQYRILVNQKIRGKNIDKDYSLGMAFDDSEAIKPSPAGNIIAYHKRATPVENYSCIYLSYLNSEKPDLELVTGPTGAKIKWIDNRYLECSSEEISYLYDTEMDKIIPLSANLLSSRISIIKVEENKIIYRGMN